MLETHVFFSGLLSHSPYVPVLRVAQNSAVRVQWDQWSEASALTLCSGPFPGMAPSQPPLHFSYRIPTRSLETHPFLLSPPGLCSLGTAISPSKQEPGCIPRCSVDCRATSLSGGIAPCSVTESHSWLGQSLGVSERAAFSLLSVEAGSLLPLLSIIDCYLKY